MRQARPALYWAGSSRTRLAFLAILLCCALVAFWVTEPYPLSHAHWDSAVYLLEGRNYADGEYLPRLRAQAPGVHDELMRGLFPREYWLFTRLGHIMIVGEAVEALGARASVGAIVGLYRILFALGLLTAVVLAVNLVHLLSRHTPGFPIYVGAGISLILYLLSDIASYLSGNLVSEVPAMLLLGLSAWTLSVAWARRSVWLAVVSGCLGFLLYVVRMEGVWLYVSFLVAFSAIVGLRFRTWGMTVTAAAASLLLFLAYSWLFFPLTDPRLFAAATVTGVKILGASAGGTGSEIVAANGLLWIGAVIALPLAWSSKATRLGVLWLILCMLPIAVALSANYGTQTRMFTMLTPPLMLLSTMGWSVLIMRAREGQSRALLAASLIVSLICVSISQPATYSRLRALPGMWRLQYIQEFLATKRFERIDYHLPELTEISHAIERLSTPCAVIVSPKLQAADHIMVIQYLGAFGEKAWTGASAARREATPATVDLYLSISPSKDLSYADLRSMDRSIFLLGSTEETDWLNGFAGLGELEEVYATPNFTLMRITRSDLADGAVPRTVRSASFLTSHQPGSRC